MGRPGIASAGRDAPLDAELDRRAHTVLALAAIIWAPVGITRVGFRRALVWGGAIGGGLMLLDWVNTWFYYRAGNPPVVEMESIPADRRLIVPSPVLVLAEEFLWRAMALSARRDRGWNMHAASDPPIRVAGSSPVNVLPRAQAGFLRGAGANGVDRPLSS